MSILNKGIIIFFLFFTISQGFSQVGIGTTDPKRTLHVEGSMKIKKLEDKTEDKKYDRVLLLKSKVVTKTVTEITSSGVIKEKIVEVAGKGDIHYAPRRIFTDFTAIDVHSKSRLVRISNTNENIESDNTERPTKATKELWYDSYMTFDDVSFIIDKRKGGKYQFQYQPTLYDNLDIISKEAKDYGIENRAVVLHIGGNDNLYYKNADLVNLPKKRNGEYYYLIKDVSSVGIWRNLFQSGAGAEDIELKGDTVSEYILFNFGVPFSVDNPYQSIYRVRSHVFYNNVKELGLPSNTAYIAYTIQELARTKVKDPPDVSKKNSLWLTGAFVGRSGNAGNLVYNNDNQYPIGIEIYIPDPSKFEWEDARFFEIRYGGSDPRPLFKSSTQFHELKRKMENGKIGNFIYLYYADKEDQFEETFPVSDYGHIAHSNSKLYNMKPTTDEYNKVSGLISIIIYYKGAVVDAIGKGLGETLQGTVEEEDPNNPGKKIEVPYNVKFPLGGWIKRKPNTKPRPDGLFEYDDWYQPKNQDTYDYRERPFKLETDNPSNPYPFPIGNRPSEGKNNSHWKGESCPGYTVP